MIPAQAVEAAAAAVYGHQLDEGVREATHARLRIALEAAAPHMLAGAREAAAADEWGTDYWGPIESEPTEGHARKVAKDGGANIYRRSTVGDWEPTR